MTKLVGISGLAAVFLLAASGPTRADSWSREWTGPYGVHRSATVRCGYHGCAYNMHARGPGGATWFRSGGVWHGPYRSYGYRAVTGPAGNTYVARRVWRRY